MRNEREVSTFVSMKILMVHDPNCSFFSYRFHENVAFPQFSLVAFLNPNSQISSFPFHNPQALSHSLYDPFYINWISRWSEGENWLAYMIRSQSEQIIFFWVFDRYSVNKRRFGSLFWLILTNSCVCVESLSGKLTKMPLNSHVHFLMYPQNLILFISNPEVFLKCSSFSTTSSFCLVSTSTSISRKSRRYSVT